MRSDLSAVCVPCRARFSRARPCPSCGRAVSIDLRRAQERARARAAFGLGAPASPPELAVRLVSWVGRWQGAVDARAKRAYEQYLISPWGFGVSMALGAITCAILQPTAVRWGSLGPIPPNLVLGAVIGATGPWLLVPMAALAVYLPILTVAWLLVLLAWLFDLVRAGTPRLVARLRRAPTLLLDTSLPAPPDGAPERREVLGILRAVSPLRSPLAGTPCAAARVIGRGPSGAIDDAVVSDFDVELPGGGRALVRGGVAVLELDVWTAPAHVATSDLLETFLAERSVGPLGAGVRLAEALLVDGDEVSIEGVAVPEAGGELDGYRDPNATLRFDEANGGPLVIQWRAGPSAR